jgi:hypothetical protein
MTSAAARIFVTYRQSIWQLFVFAPMIPEHRTTSDDLNNLTFCDRIFFPNLSSAALQNDAPMRLSYWIISISTISAAVHDAANNTGNFASSVRSQ